MEKETIVRSNNISSANIMSSVREKNGGDGSLPLRASSDSSRQATTSDLVLQWGNRKRLRCMKVQVKDDSSGPIQRTMIRRVVRTDKDSLNKSTFEVNNNNLIHTHNNNHHSNGYPNLRQRPSSPQPRLLRAEALFNLPSLAWPGLHLGCGSRARACTSLFSLDLVGNMEWTVSFHVFWKSPFFIMAVRFADPARLLLHVPFFIQ